MFMAMTCRARRGVAAIALLTSLAGAASSCDSSGAARPQPQGTTGPTAGEPVGDVGGTLLAAGCRAPTPPTYPVRSETLFGGFTFEEPTGLVPSPVAGEWFVLERKGRIRRARETPTGWVVSDALDIRSEVYSDIGDDGMLGLAVSPDFAVTGEVFVHYTSRYLAPVEGSSNYRSRIARFKSADGGRTLDRASEKVVLDVNHENWGHNGGPITFGPDRLFYLALGDGFYGDPFGWAQDPNVLFGKVLRLDVLGKEPYAIPPDNPFAGGGGRPEVFAVGFRNPWSMSIDPGGRIWVADVGHDSWEEINIVIPGGNYGWSHREGAHCFDKDPCISPEFIDPVWEYPHADGLSVKGGFTYRGTKLPWLVGKYVFGDFLTGRLWSLEQVGGTWTANEILDSAFGITAITEGIDHEIYIADMFVGRMHRLEPSEVTAEPPSSLRSLGCLDDARADGMAQNLVPYEVNAALWSDGLDKSRWFALPQGGGQIHVTESGDWELPDGSMALKTFSFEGHRVETRMMTRTGDRWIGYAFAWNEAQDDAVLLTTGKKTSAGGLPWDIPSRAQCFACHTSAAGRTLGLETGQLNRTVVGADGHTVNQIESFAARGLLDAPIALATAPRIADYASGAPIEDRARAYLHANCAHCHRALGPGGGVFDLRATIPREDMKLFCVPFGAVVTPGDPDASLLIDKASRRGAGQMPPLGTSQVDSPNVDLLRQWVSSLPACKN